MDIKQQDVKIHQDLKELCFSNYYFQFVDSPLIRDINTGKWKTRNEPPSALLFVVGETLNKIANLPF